MTMEISTIYELNYSNDPWHHYSASLSRISPKENKKTATLAVYLILSAQPQHQDASSRWFSVFKNGL